MKPPCEIVVWYVIPSIRSQLAKELLSLGMKQKDVSNLMDITQPAVSQYITNKRGHGVILDIDIKELVEILAKDLFEGKAKKEDITKRICLICMKINTPDVVKQLGFDESQFPDICGNCIGN